MNSRERFQETMCYGAIDHVPLFEEGIREEVLETWQIPGNDLAQFFSYDGREEIDTDLYSALDVTCLPPNNRGLRSFRDSLDADDPERLPENWRNKVRDWKERQHVLMLDVHEGLFLTLRVKEAESFQRAIYLITDHPQFVRQLLEIQGEFAAKIAERVLKEVVVEAAIFGEPVASSHGPLVSPRTYGELVLPSYRPILDVLHKYRVETIIFRTYANARLLLPAVVQAGFNCLWANERQLPAMDYLDIRREFGRELRLIGGIDLDVLRQDETAIQCELDRVLSPLLAQGGYIPLLDGRVRENIPFERYSYYRRELEARLKR